MEKRRYISINYNFIDVASESIGVMGRKKYVLNVQASDMVFLCQKLKCYTQEGTYILKEG